VNLLAYLEDDPWGIASRTFRGVVLRGDIVLGLFGCLGMGVVEL
jgi:hypothetical protein